MSRPTNIDGRPAVAQTTAPGTSQRHTDTRPLVLVDIDGVLNAFEARRATTHQRLAVAGRYRVVLDDRHPGWFDILGEYAELRWATMWQADAGRVFGRVAGLGTDWDHLDFDSAWNTGSARRTGHGVGGYKWPMIEPLGDGDAAAGLDRRRHDRRAARVGAGPERRRSAHAVRPARPGGRLRRRAVRPGAELRPASMPAARRGRTPEIGTPPELGGVESSASSHSSTSSGAPVVQLSVSYRRSIRRAASPPAPARSAGSTTRADAPPAMSISPTRTWAGGGHRAECQAPQWFPRDAP